MKILIVSQRYWPENFRITNIAESLVSAGNFVTVVTGLPNYPIGKVYSNYRKGKNRIENHNGVKIIRAFEFPKKKNLFGRLLNYYSFPFFAKKIIKNIDSEFDVVFVNELSPIMSCYPAIHYARKNKKPLIMYEMDLWPESLLAGGIKKNSFVYRHFSKVAANIYSKCDKILVSTKEHSDIIKKLPGCQNISIDYLPQYAEDIFLKTKNISKNDNHPLEVMFAGNIGIAQNIQTIIECANLVKNESFRFHLVGDGVMLKTIRKMAKDYDLNNVIFYGNKPLNEMPAIFEIADVMLVTLEDKDYSNVTVPGKIQSYMAAGKPTICCANGSTANFILDNSIGFCCKSGDYKGLSVLLRSLTRKDLERIGLNARRVFEQKYCKEIFISKLISSFMEK